jgi:His-Xaa-Ser system radical SAM maturase HxsC
MITLRARGVAANVDRRLLLRVATSPEVTSSRVDHVWVTDPAPSPAEAAGFGAVLSSAPANGRSLPLPHVSGIAIDHLAAGDVVSIERNGEVRTLYRRASPHNAIFATDRCNSYCLMCSQPPRKIDDSDRLAEHLRLIRLVDPATESLGITGGEPTLFKEGFLELVRACKENLPNTALHVLTNGRLFHYRSFARALGEIDHPDLMLGIPLYSDIDYEHDHVVQARHAFDETMTGLQNLAVSDVPVEIRIVVHRLTYERLPELAEFIYRNLAFASHVTFMGLEPMGFAVANLEMLWIDPWDYREQLERAVFALTDRGMNVSIYNHQLCTLPERLWRYARRSISDWKNEYLPECDACQVREQCGGFFASSLRRNRWSTQIHAL